MPEFLTTISWSSPATIGIIICVVAILAVAGYFIHPWVKKHWPSS